MSRAIAIGLTAMFLAACNPSDQTEPAAPAPSAPAVAAPVTPAAPDTPSDQTSWEATKDRYRNVLVAPSDPLEALEWRGVGCQYYGEEFAGDRSERDQWLNAQLDRLDCGDPLVAEARAMRDARSGDPAVVARLNAVIAVYE